MPSYTIEPTQSGAYDVIIRDADGTERIMRGLANLHAALEWVAVQKEDARLSTSPDRGAHL